MIWTLLTYVCWIEEPKKSYCNCFSNDVLCVIFGLKKYNFTINIFTKLSYAKHTRKLNSFPDLVGPLWELRGHIFRSVSLFLYHIQDAVYNYLTITTKTWNTAFAVPPLGHCTDTCIIHNKKALLPVMYYGVHERSRHAWTCYVPCRRSCSL